jgi:hypothetical protein
VAREVIKGIKRSVSNKEGHSGGRQLLDKWFGFSARNLTNGDWLTARQNWP